MLVPSASTRQVMGTLVPKEGGKHATEDCTEQLLLGSQAACDLADKVPRQAQIVEGLVEGFDRALGLFLLAFVARFRVEVTAVDGFGVLCDVSLSAGHGAGL